MSGPVEIRRLALAHATAVALPGTKADRIVAAAAAFEAYLTGGAQPAPIEQQPPEAVLVNFLQTVRDLDTRTFEGDITAFNPVDTAVLTIPMRIGRAAERAGLVVESDHGRWSLTGRGREAADRGTI